MKRQERLFNFEFIALTAITFFTYCNIAVFFQFHHYLETLSIPSEWNGFLIAVFSFAALVVRPIVSPLITSRNSKKWMFISCCLLVGSLTLYNFSTDFWSMTITRLIHGATYVVMGTAVISRMVAIIPQDRSSQAFGLLSVVSLLPYALVPPLLQPLSDYLGGFDGALNISAVVMLINLPIIALLKNPEGGVSQKEYHFSLREIVANLRTPEIASLLIINMVIWTCFTTIFYFIKGFGDKVGVPNPGWFLTISTVTEMAVRVFAGNFFDRVNKKLLLQFSLLWLAVSYFLLGIVTGPTTFYALGLLLGLGWGVVLPVINGFLFDVSEPRFRALNANLAAEMFQAGFTLGPFLGGMILISYGYMSLFVVTGLISLLGLPLTLRSTKDRQSTCR